MHPVGDDFMNDAINLIVNALGVFVHVISGAMMIRCLFSWMPLMSRNNPLYALVYRLTEPLYAPVRKMVAASPLGGGMPVDFSPVFAFLMLEAAYRLIVVILSSFTGAG